MFVTYLAYCGSIGYLRIVLLCWWDIDIRFSIIMIQITISWYLKKIVMLEISIVEKMFFVWVLMSKDNNIGYHRKVIAM